MPSLIRHVGRLNNTGTRIAVVFRTLPDDPTQCLVVETDRLPDMYQDNMKTILNSNEAQSTVNLYEVLGKRTFGDGQQVLTALHSQGLLRKVPVEQVTLYPLPNRSLPLADANREIDGVTNDLAMEHEPVAEVERVVGEVAGDTDDPKAMAEALILQAKLLDDEASRKREEAYTLYPDLRPGRGRPKLTQAEKELKRKKLSEKRKAQRQERKAQMAKEEAKAKIDEKVVRDAKRAAESNE